MIKTTAVCDVCGNEVHKNGLHVDFNTVATGHHSFTTAHPDLKVRNKDVCEDCADTVYARIAAVLDAIEPPAEEPSEEPGEEQSVEMPEEQVEQTEQEQPEQGEPSEEPENGEE